MMLHTIKTFRIDNPLAWFPQCLSSNIGRVSIPALRFCTKNSSEKAAEDVKSDSIEEGYGATRSDEKGFEGANDGKQATSKIEMDKFIHEDHPAYDKTQTKKNEVKEKENASH